MLITLPKNLAAIIINQRKKLKLSQSEVGNLVGLKQSTISAFENQPEKTKLDTLFRILAALNLEIEISPKNKAIKTATDWKEEW